MEKKKDQGYTMIIVMCLMFLFMALALSMLFSSALLLARAERAGMQKQCRASAVSFTEWMDVELEKGSGTGMLCKNITDRMYDDPTKNWPSYTGGLGHEADVAVLKFKPDTSGVPELEKLGELEVSMYWERWDGSAAVTEKDDPEVDLVVTVKAVVKDEQYSVTTRYEKLMEAETLEDGTSKDVWNGKWSMEGRE